MIYQYKQLSLADKFFSLLIVTIPISLISGPFIPDLCISLCAIFFLTKTNSKKFFKNYFLFLFLLFCTIIIISSLINFELSSLKSSLFYFRFGLFSLLFWNLIEKDDRILDKLFLVLLFSFSILIFDSLFQYFNGFNILGMKIVMEARISSFFGTELKMGSYLFRLFPLLVSLIFLQYSKNKNKQFLFIFFFITLFLEVVIYLSGERTSFLLFNFSILLFLIFLNQIKIFKLFLIFSSLFLLTLLFIFETPYKYRLIDLSKNQTNFFKKDAKKYIFSKQYHEHYLSSFKMFKDNKIFGIGPKKFRIKCKEEKYNFSELTCSTHPHNTLLQLLSETGILGFICYITAYLFLWYLLIINVIKKIHYKREFLSNFQISLIIYFVISLWPVAPSGNFFNNWLSTIYYLPVGILLWSFRNNKKIYI